MTVEVPEDDNKTVITVKEGERKDVLSKYWRRNRNKRVSRIPEPEYDTPELDYELV